MLSLLTCRSLIGADGERLEDSELTILREQIYDLVICSLELCSRDHGRNQSLKFNSMLSAFNQSDKELIEERAAVIEFEGNLDREVAERAAITQAINEWDN